MSKQRAERPWLYPPETVINGRYRVIRRVSYGGSAEVYEVEHLELCTHLALKVAHPEYVANPGVLEHITTLMKREARVGAQLRARAGRPGAESIVFVTDVGTTDDKYRLPFFVMELLQGHTLYARIRFRREARDPFPISYVLRFATNLAKVLLLLHEEGIIHCDLKPQNLFLHRSGSGPVLKLLDLGLMARAGQTPLDRFQGTPWYAAPEQFLLRAPTFETDTYSFGMVVYEMITQRGPWDTVDAPLSEPALRAAHLGLTVPPMRTFRADVPEDVDALVLAMLSKEPDGRPALLKVAERLHVMLKRTLAARGVAPAEDPPDLTEDPPIPQVTTQPGSDKPLVVEQRERLSLDVPGAGVPPEAITAPPTGTAGNSKLLVPLTVPPRGAFAVAASATRSASRKAASSSRPPKAFRTDPDPEPRKFSAPAGEHGTSVPAEEASVPPAALADPPRSPLAIAASTTRARSQNLPSQPRTPDTFRTDPDPQPPNFSAPAGEPPARAAADEPAAPSSQASSRSSGDDPEGASPPPAQARAQNPAATRDSKAGVDESALRARERDAVEDKRWGESPFAHLHQEGRSQQAAASPSAVSVPLLREPAPTPSRPLAVGGKTWIESPLTEQHQAPADRSFRPSTSLQPRGPRSSSIHGVSASIGGVVSKGPTARRGRSRRGWMLAAAVVAAAGAFSVIELVLPRVQREPHHGPTVTPQGASVSPSSGPPLAETPPSDVVGWFPVESGAPDARTTASGSASAAPTLSSTATPATKAKAVATARTSPGDDLLKPYRPDPRL